MQNTRRATGSDAVSTEVAVADINRELYGGERIIILAPSKGKGDKERRWYCSACGRLYLTTTAIVIRRHCETNLHQLALVAMRATESKSMTESAMAGTTAPKPQQRVLNGSMRTRIDEANRLYHKGLPVICETTFPVGAKCTLCNNLTLRKEQVVAHCQKSGHSERYQEHLALVAETARRADVAATRMATRRYKRDVQHSEPLVDHSGRQLIVLISTSLRHVDDAVQSQEGMCWAPEVDAPRSNVHYVQVRHRSNGGAVAPSAKAPDADAPDPWAFRVLPVAHSAETARNGDNTQPSLLVPSVLQHVASGLYITASFSPRGLLWLHDDIDRAAIASFVPVESFVLRKRRGNNGAAVNHGELRYVLCISEQRINAPTWIAIVYSPQSGVQRPGDMGVTRRDRRSLVLLEGNIARSTAFKADPSLYQFCVTVLAEHRALNVNGHHAPTRQRKHRRRARKRTRENNPDTTDSASGGAEDTDAISDANASLTGDDDGDAGASQSPRSRSIDNDDEASSADETFLAQAAEHGDAFGLFVRRAISCSYWQDRCIRKVVVKGKVQWTCGVQGAKRFTVIGFGNKDHLIRSVLSTQLLHSSIAPSEAEGANCMVCVLSGGIPGSLAHCRIPVLVTTREVSYGEPFVVLASSVEKYAATTDDFAWYMAHYGAVCAPPGTPPPQRSVALIPPHSDAGGGEPFVAWPAGALYYYGNHRASAVPASQAVLEFPFNLTQVRPCMRLRGELEVVAKYLIPRGTCFLYCGPPIRAADDHEGNTTAQSTAMRINREGRKIEGGNTMKFVNHHFGFAPEGNVAFRRGAVVYRQEQVGRKPAAKCPSKVGETHVIFFVATRDIAPGECLLAESYGPEYDSFIERIALCGGRFLSTEERALLHSDGVGGIEGTYHGCYVSDIHVGSIVGRREPPLPARSRGLDTGLGGAMVFYLVTTVTDENVLLGEALTVRFPFLFVREDDNRDGGTTAVLRKTEVVLFIPGWDYKDVTDPASGRTGAKLNMPRAALDRVSYDDLL